MKFFVLIFMLAGTSAFAASQTGGITTKKIQEYLKKATHQTTVSSAFGVTEVSGYDLNVFQITPKLSSDLEVVTTEFSIPFTWITQTDPGDDESTRTVGRPRLAVIRSLHKHGTTQLTGGVAVKLPIYSGPDGQARLLRRWMVQPLLEGTLAIGPKSDFVWSTGLEWNSVGKVKAGTSSVTFQQAPVFHLAGAVNYHHDKNLTFGASAKAFTGIGDNKVNMRLDEETFQDKAPRDSLVLGASAKLRLNQRNFVEAGIFSAIRGEDTLPGALAAPDRVEDASKFAAALSLIRQF